MLQMLRRRLGMESSPFDETMGMEEASDLIDTLKDRLAVSEEHADAEDSAPREHPHAHLPLIGTKLDPHRKIDERIFITDNARRQLAYQAGPEHAASYFSKCRGTYYVADYIPDSPIVVAECDLCHVPFAFKVVDPANRWYRP